MARSMTAKTRQEIAAEVLKELPKFFREQLGEEAKAVLIEVLDDTIIVRFKDALPLAEKRLGGEPKGAKLIQELKMKLIEELRPGLDGLLERITGIPIVDSYSSIDLAKGERVEVFTLNAKI